ncbi:MAG: Uma2 family endonuclease [Runella sp.]
MEYQIALNMGDYMTDDEFFRFCQMNDNLSFERNANGQIIIMPPTTSKTGIANLKIGSAVFFWNENTDFGLAFDSSTGFKLPNGATRSPDVAWIRKDRWQQLTPEQQESFAPICPDFVVEIRSKSDDLKTLQDKMEEYKANGCQLGWLIDLKNQEVYVYRNDQAVEKVENFEQKLSGENVLQGFSFDLKKLSTL